MYTGVRRSIFLVRRRQPKLKSPQAWRSSLMTQSFNNSLGLFTRKSRRRRINNNSSSSSSNSNNSKARASSNSKTSSNSNNSSSKAMPSSNSRIRSHSASLRTRKTNRKRTTSCRQRTSRKKNSNILARPLLPLQRPRSNKAHSLHPHQANAKAKNRRAPAKEEKMKRLHRPREKVKMKTRHHRRLPANLRKRNLPVKGREPATTNHKSRPIRTRRLPKPNPRRRAR